MKKKVKLAIFFSVVFIALFNIKSFATIEIENYEINCEVTNSGNMNVQENITYKTDEYMNGITRNINVRNDININNSADKLVLNSVKVNGEEQERVAFATNGRSGIYEYRIKEDNYDIKVFSPIRDDSITVTYEYTLENVITKYNDTAELFWNFISDIWNINIKNLEINITLPLNSVNKDIYTFGYGSDNAEIEKNRNEIKIKLKDLEPHQPIDIRILFNQDSMSATNKIIEKDYLKNYIKKEQGFIKNREDIKLLGIFTVKQIMITFIIIIIAIWIVVYLILKKGTSKKKKNIKWPVILSSILTGFVVASATIMAIILNNFSISINSNLLLFFLITTTIIFSIWFKTMNSTNKFMLFFVIILFLVFQYLNIMIFIGNELILMYIPYLLSFAFIQYTLKQIKQNKEVENV